MEFVIHKYRIGEQPRRTEEILLPYQSQPISAGFQNGHFVVWVKEPVAGPREEVAMHKFAFRAIQTGQPSTQEIGWQFIRTIFIGDEVYHVFYTLNYRT